MLQLSTARMDFQRYTEADLEQIARLVTNPDVMHYIGDGQVKDKTYARELLTRMQEQYENFEDFGLHKLVLKETGDMVGHAGIVAQIIDDAFEIELGYWLFPEFWGHGYAMEAAEALLHYAIEELELERVISVIQIENTASINIAKKNGMHLEKTIVHEGKDVHVYCWKAE
ncbi:MAG: GNAT family N-acetyltransferase [Solibacillus sp.]